MPVLSLFCISCPKSYMAACHLKPLTINFLKICRISCWVIFKVDPVLGCYHHHVAVGCDVEVVEELATSIFTVKWEGWKCSWDGLIGHVMSNQTLAPPIICLPVYLWVHPCMHASQLYYIPLASSLKRVRACSPKCQLSPPTSQKKGSVLEYITNFMWCYILCNAD